MELIIIIEIVTHTLNDNFFSVSHGIYLKTDHILGQKSSLKRLKKWNNTLSSNWPNEFNLDIHKIWSSWKATNTRKQNNSLRDENLLKTEIKKEVKTYHDQVSGIDYNRGSSEM